MKEHDNGGSGVFLTGCILIANLDFNGLMDYGLKALVGGAIWLGFNRINHYLAERKNRKDK